MAAIQEHYPRNPHFGSLCFSDYFLLFYCVVRILVWDLPLFLLTYPYIFSHTTPRSTSFGDHLTRFLIRKTNELFNPALTRWASRPGHHHVDIIFSSPRYGPHHKNIYHPVSRRDFAGYWILQSSLVAPKPPSTSDVTVLYLHGGGYFCSQPAHYLLFLLRLAESILNQGVSISIFALDYSLAPEHTFPTQLAEAAAAYKYILDEKRVSPGKIVVAGDSAGGHLALSLLVHLDKPFPSIPDAYGCLPKPLGLVLISPCLSLYHEPPSYVSNKHIDILSGLFLRRIATHFLNGSTEISANKEVPNRDSPYVEFLTPNPEVNWESVLPPWVCALAGADEIFFDGIRGWVETVREKLGHGRVVLNVGVEKEHAWQFLETMLDAGTKKYLESNVGDEGGFEETAKIGEMIVERMRISNH